MPTEREAKLRIADPQAVRRALIAAGARYLGTVLQTDRFFDFPDGHLRKADSTLRLRQEELADGRRKTRGKAMLTYKGPRRPNPRIKVRKEIEADVEDPEIVAGALRQAGLIEAVTIQKRRSSYRLGRCRVEIDELPRIGCFVEIEGPAERAIASVRKKLRLAGPPILRPYLELLADHCRREKLPFRRILLRKR